jgi:hypothetical protein
MAVPMYLTYSRIKPLRFISHIFNTLLVEYAGCERRQNLVSLLLLDEKQEERHTSH